VMNSEKETPYELCHIIHTYVCGACVGAGVAQSTDHATGWTIGVRNQIIQISCATTQLVLGVKRPEREVDH
jgi:hypothetical protein